MADNNKPTENTGGENDISKTERELLDDSMTNSLSDDNMDLKRAQLDNLDEDGVPLNESSDELSGEDLDIPGAELDDEGEQIGREDEENNSYSEADTE